MVPRAWAVIVGFAAATAAGAHPAAQTIVVRGDDFAMFLRSFAPRARVAIGAELIDPHPPFNGPMKEIDTPLAPDEGVAAIVASDSRYEWARENGVIHIRPKAALRAAGPLDRIVKRFAVSREPFGAVLDRILWSDGPLGAGGGGVMFGTDAPQTALITMSVEQEAPVRAVLDELCRIGGGASWVARPAGTAGGLHVEIIGSTWTVTRSTGGVIAAPFPSSPGGRPVAATFDGSSALKQPSLLDTLVDRFDADAEPVEMVFERLIWRMGIEPGGGRAARPGSPWLSPVTLHVTHPATVRELLNELTKAVSGTSWSFRPELPGGHTSIQLRSGTDWPLVRLVWLPMGMLNLPVAKPTRAPAVTLPPPFTRDMPQTLVYIGGDLDTSFARVAEFAHQPIGIELVPQRPVNTNVRNQPVEELILGPGPFSDALFVLLEHQPDYTLTLDGGVPNILPVEVSQRPAHFLDVALDRFVAKDVSIIQAIYTLRHLLNPAFPEFEPRSGGFAYIGGARSAEQMQSAQEMFNRRVTLEVDHATPRQILNKLVAKHGGVFWTVEYRRQQPTEPASAIEAHCTLSLRTFDDISMSMSFTPRR